MISGPVTKLIVGIWAVEEASIDNLIVFYDNKRPYDWCCWRNSTHTSFYAYFLCITAANSVSHILCASREEKGRKQRVCHVSMK